MLPKITYQDVAARFQDGESLGDETYVQNLIDDVVDDITVKWGPRIKARLDAEIITERTLKRVVSAVVLRVLRNPDGIYRESLGNYEYQMSQKVAAGYVTYLQEEIDTLIGVTPSPFGSSNMNVTSAFGGRMWPGV